MNEPLDHELAARLRAAAEHEPYPTLDEAARARVLDALQAERPSERGTRMLWLVGVTAAAAAVALALLAGPSKQLACALPTDARFSERGELDLGAYGRVVLAAGAQASVTRAESCALELTLRNGRLAAALHNLRPASLSVRTPLGAVEVHGTTFSVQLDDGLEVVLLEGAVTLLEDGVAPVPLAPGAVLTRSDKASRPRIASVDAAKTKAVRELLSPPPAPAAQVEPEEPEPVADAAAAAQPALPEQTATSLLEAAEQQRRDGKLRAARALYREASVLPGGDAEVALLRWARLELTDQHPRGAQRVLSRYRARYGRDYEQAQLGAEASFLELQTLSALGDPDKARQKAAELIQRYPDSPHAKAAAEWKP